MKADYQTFAPIKYHYNELFKKDGAAYISIIDSHKAHNKTYFPIIPYRTNMCTHVNYDFDLMKWTDYEFMENVLFVNKWTENFECVLPQQPYQPVLVTLGYEHSLINPFANNFESMVVQLESITGSFMRNNLVQERKAPKKMIPKRLTLIRVFLGLSPSAFSGKKIHNHPW